MKKILLGSALTALLCNANAEVDQSLTGLHVGLGINVLFDEYSADVDVAEGVFANGSTITAAVTTQGKPAPDDTGNAGVKAIADAVFAAAKAGQSTVSFSATVDNGQTIASENGALTLANMAWLSKRTNFKRRATNVGGELKLAYFHDFGNKFMIGVDLSGTIVSKTKKHVKNPSFAKQKDDTLTWETTPGIGTMTDDGTWTATATDSTDKITVTAAGSYANAATAQAANPGATVLRFGAGVADWNTDYDHIKNTHIFAGDKSEVAFEKDAFIPRLAFVLGGTYLGWFAGLRLGMAYMTGKVTATDANGSHSKSVSISSPFIGLHLMKQMNIKGINNGHVYVTADWHVGDGHRAVNINGIKSFKQNAFNLAAGLTWRCKLGR